MSKKREPAKCKKHKDKQRIREVKRHGDGAEKKHG
jgi:hypothetical protein